MSDPATFAVRRVSAGRAAPGPLAIGIEDVAMTYPGGVSALAGASLAVERGAFVSIVGPSGCGKSTLARVAAGLETHTGGVVRIDRDRLAFTFQEPTLLPWRRVRANVELLMELRGVARAERRRIAEAMIRLVGLEGFEEAYPRALSGGMKMRASLARSLALDPSAFLFDEPFSALDEITRERLVEELAALYAARRFTGLFITHSIPEAVFLSTRVAVMTARPGRIAAEFAVDAPFPRDPSIRFSPGFAEGCETISRALRDAMRAEAA